MTLHHVRQVKHCIYFERVTDLNTKWQILPNVADPSLTFWLNLTFYILFFHLFQNILFIFWHGTESMTRLVLKAAFLLFFLFLETAYHSSAGGPQKWLCKRPLVLTELSLFDLWPQILFGQKPLRIWPPPAPCWTCPANTDESSEPEMPYHTPYKKHQTNQLQWNNPLSWNTGS